MNALDNHIKNIIFDVSDVLTTFAHDPKWSNTLLAEEYDVPVERVQAFFDEWGKVAGKVHGMSLEEFWSKKTVDLGPIPLSAAVASAERHAEDIMVDPVMIEILKKLQPHYRLFALTNIWKPGHPFKPELDPYFEAFVQSCDINLRKPEPAAFDYILRTYKLKPRETLFIDNHAENVEGAQSVGIYAFLFTTVEALREELKRYGIDV